jgi:hypothetical protein
MLLQILMFVFLKGEREDKGSWPERQQVFREFRLLLVSSERRVLPNIGTWHHDPIFFFPNATTCPS